MMVGYARVSTDDQSADLQTNALAAAGCERIFEDIGVSGSLETRPALDKVIDSLQPGDTLVA
jgi:DNA invertase Pin-like site-specific DNA recombinase